MEKQPWVTPELTIHGDVESLTQNSTATNRDSPSGASNTAFPNSP